MGKKGGDETKEQRKRGEHEAWRLEQSTAKRALLTRLATAVMGKRYARGQTLNVIGMHTSCGMFGCLASAHDKEKLRYDLDAFFCMAPTLNAR